ncbi:WxcM-like domain-containing protein [Luteimonas sp. MC1828]|uniref:WxcM-like domain-containing protein n=1 Tax=Luteimonas sp. MC1828 TaxID=2799787 RepID=UPI0018F1656A|nr:WxcM-like domain-containing protein [Luteimonas sp. MC1828]MBJ7575054.1 WxcM-like domain-containing protein [Luteimonas sp. MC1828]
MSHYVHPNALCESDSIGAGTRVWAFAHVLPGARIGRDCNVCDGVFIEGDVVVGDRTTIKCGVQLWDGVRLGDDVFVGPNATFSNDIFPRSRQRPERYAETVVEDGASIGANATLLPGVRIGRGAMIGAGAVITRSVPANAIVVGNPARIVGYVTDDDAGQVLAGDTRDAPRESASPTPAGSGSDPLPGTGGARMVRLPRFIDLRGSLAVGEFARDLPFAPARYFLVFDVPSRETRGEHAHRECHQFLVCVHGSVRVLADDGRHRREFTLDAPELGLHLPPMTWGTQYRYSPDAVLLVFASHAYDAADYVRDYDTFLALAAAAPGA